MALTKDIQTYRYGTSDGHENAALGILAAVVLYRGSIALESAATPGYLKSSAVPAATDICWGIVERIRPGDGIDGAPGITGGASNGTIGAEVAQGTFFLGSSSGADLLSVATIGKTVYVYDEQTVAATNGGGTRPAAGIHVATDSRYGGGFAVKMGNNQSTGGGF